MGDSGPAGAKGDQGPQGETGPQGPEGPAGPAGSAGTCTAPAPQVIGDVTFEGIGSAPVAIYSFSAGATMTPTTIGGGAGAGKVNFQDIVISKVSDAISPRLLLETAQGRHIQRVTINVYAAGSTTAQVTYRLEDVIITGFNNTHVPGAGAVENVTLKFDRLRVDAGGQEMTWDVSANTKL